MKMRMLSNKTVNNIFWIIEIIIKANSARTFFIWIHDQAVGEGRNYEIRQGWMVCPFGWKEIEVWSYLLIGFWLHKILNRIWSMPRIKLSFGQLNH